MSWAIIVQMFLVNVLEINVFISLTATTIFHKVQPALWTRLHSTSQNDIQMVSVIITIFSDSKTELLQSYMTCSRSYTRSQAKAMLWILEIPHFIQLHEQIQRKSQNLNKGNSVKSVLIAIFHFHGLFIFICPKNEEQQLWLRYLDSRS